MTAKTKTSNAGYIKSKMLLRNILEDFEANGLPNQTYLEEKINLLERLVMLYSTQSRNPQILPRHRARARDLEQNAVGLINGIKFGISFMLHKDMNLAEMESGNE
jgi:hypothetical protein